MTNTFNWFGLNLRVSKTDGSGRVGVVIGGMKMLNDHMATAQKIADAGPGGLDRYEVQLGHVDTLKRANVPITSDACGMRFYLDKAPTPSGYLIEAAEEAKSPTHDGGHHEGSPRPWGNCTHR